MTDFNPSEHNVDEVIAHLEQADTDEQVRVLEAEASDKDRATIRDWEPAPSADTEPKGDADTDEQEFEQTEENAILLLAAAAELGLNPDVVTTKNGALQAPDSVVKAAGDHLTTDKD